MPETLLDSPITSLHTFGILLPAISEESPEHAAAALHYATVLANDLARWDGHPYQGADAAIMKIAKLFRARMRNATSLTAWDKKALTNAYLEALSIAPDTSLDSGDIKVSLFNTAYALIETAWREDGRL